MQTIIHVALTQTEINIGKVKLCTLCPVALAIKRAFALHCVHADVWVGVNSMPGGAMAILEGRLIALPEEVGHWIELYDSGIKLGPIEFDMEIPNELLGGV